MKRSKFPNFVIPAIFKRESRLLKISGSPIKAFGDDNSKVAGCLLFSFFLLPLFLFSSCASGGILGFQKLETPPEFKQKVQLEVSEDYEMRQAPVSGYDAGDLQSFHIQHTLPIVVEDAFKELFGEVEMKPKGPAIETEVPEVPAVFEVRLIDIFNDNTNPAAQSYRGEVTLAVAMKSPRGNVFWQQSFRGEGYVQVNPQFPESTGPNEAMTDALRDALGQMQEAIIASPQVRLQMQHYQEIDRARRQNEVKS